MGPLLLGVSFLTYELPALLNPPSSYCSELGELRELGYSLERCTDRCIRTIIVYPLADPADSFVLVLLAWETSENRGLPLLPLGQPTVYLSGQSRAAAQER